MFTVKHQTESGDELYETADVTFTSGETPASSGAVWRRRGNELVPMQGGVVFVMNEHGATVSKYDMRVMPQPQPQPQASAPSPSDVARVFSA
jgi:hypothetical protein